MQLKLKRFTQAIVITACASLTAWVVLAQQPAPPVTTNTLVNAAGNNNVRNTADFATYNVTWTTPANGDKNAAAWTTTAPFPKTLTYTYEPVPEQCVKDKLPSYAGVGKNGATLVASACGTAR